MTKARALFLLGAAIIVVLTVLTYTAQQKGGGHTPEELAQCFEGKPYEAQLACLNATTDALLATYSGQQLMNYIVASTSPVALVNECHFVGHTIGEALYRKFRSVENALAQCNSSCRNACFHGTVATAVLDELGSVDPSEDLAHADAATIRRIGEKYCARDSLCHAIGHILFGADRSYGEALSTCEAVAGTKRAAEKCYEGVFMESLGSSDSLAGTPGTQVDAEAHPCMSVSSEYRPACFRYVWGFQKKITPDKSGAALVDEAMRSCELFSGQDRVDCVEGLSNSVTDAYNGDISKLHSYCEAREKQTEKDACMRGVVHRFSDNDQLSRLMCYCDADASRSACFSAASQRLLDIGMSEEKITERISEVSARSCAIYNAQ